MYRTFKEISDNITEEEYRKDGAMHYSTLATYHREGFDGLSTLFEKKDTPSLLFGSIVDTMITGTEDEFNDNYIVQDFTSLEPAYDRITKRLFETHGKTCKELFLIPDNDIVQMTIVMDFYKHWKPETRVKVIKEKCSHYYSLLQQSEGKTVVDTTTYKDALATVDILKTSECTEKYFSNNNPWDNTIERLYQLKFSHTVDGIPYACMADLIYVDHKEKKVYPCDLKTSSHEEYKFYESFVKWCYHIQARLYWRIIRATMDKDKDFKDYSLEDYRFIVVNRKSLTPLVWEYEDTQKYGPLLYGKNESSAIKFEDPYDLGKELSEYLKKKPKVPEGISMTKENKLKEWLNKF